MDLLLDLIRTQKCETTSTTEAEYVALGDVVKEALFLRQVWRFFLPDAGKPLIPVSEDNEGAISLASKPITNSNSKHIVHLPSRVCGDANPGIPLTPGLQA